MNKKVKKTVPELRFPEFTGDWKIKKLKQITTKIGSGATPTGGDSSYKESGISLFRSLNVYDGFFKIENLAFIDQEQAKKLDTVTVREGDILFNITGASIARCCIAPKELLPARVNQHVMIIRPNIGHIITEFLSFLLICFDYKKKLLQLGGKGGSTREALTKEHIETFQVFLPPLPEQEKIAKFLSLCDEKLNSLRRKRELLETYKRGVMQQIFTQKIRFQDDDGSDFPDWEEKNFEKLVTRVKTKYNPLNEQKEYLCIELESIASNQGKLLEVFNSREQQSIKNKFNTGDVLLGKLRPYLRKFFLASFDGVCSSEIWVLRGKHISNIYLYYLIQTDKFYEISNITFGSKMPRADWDFIASFPFQYPSQKEQQKIAQFLTAIDRKIEAVSQQIERMEHFKKGLLQKMFV